MKRRLLLYSGVLMFLMVVGISTGFVIREYRHQEASHALIVAIKANNIATALAAIKAGADPNTQEDSPYSGSFVAFLKHMLNECFHTNTKTAPSAKKPLSALALHFKVINTYNSVLVKDSKTYNPVLIKALMEAGADPNVTIIGNASPLLWAAMDGNTQVVRLLLQHGAKPGLVDSGGVTTLQGASMVIGDESISEKVECAFLLLNAGANINAQDNAGDTALMAACMDSDDKNLELVRILLLHHANPCLQDFSGRTVLDFSLERQDTKIIKLLRQAGAKTSDELAMEKVVAQHVPNSKR